MNKINFICVFLLINVVKVFSDELTFELPDNEKMCFHEIIEENKTFTLEYQVITGGNYDVDVEVLSPDNVEMYKEIKKQYDTKDFTSNKKGEYKFCFSNEFSTFTHKLIYFDFKVGFGDDSLKEALEDDPAKSHHKALTQMESSTVVIHDHLNEVIEQQTHHRLKDTQGEEFAYSLNDRVKYWSAGQALMILLVGAGQILVLRSFFTDRK